MLRVCVDGGVVCASSVGGGRAGLAGEAFTMAWVSVAGWVMWGVVWGCGVGEVGLGMGLGMVGVGECVVAYDGEKFGSVWWMDGLVWGRVEEGWVG